MVPRGFVTSPRSRSFGRRVDVFRSLSTRIRASAQYGPIHPGVFALNTHHKRPERARAGAPGTASPCETGSRRPATSGSRASSGRRSRSVPGTFRSGPPETRAGSRYGANHPWPNVLLESGPATIEVCLQTPTVWCTCGTGVPPSAQKGGTERWVHVRKVVAINRLGCSRRQSHSRSASP